MDNAKHKLTHLFPRSKNLEFIDNLIFNSHYLRRLDLSLNSISLFSKPTTTTVFFDRFKLSYNSSFCMNWRRRTMEFALDFDLSASSDKEPEKSDKQADNLAEIVGIC